MADALLEGQLTLYDLITRAITNFNKLGAERKTKAAVESRLEQLQKNWSKYEANHDSLISLVTEAHKKHEYVSNSLFEAGEEEYLLAVSEFRGILDSMAPRGDDSDAQSVASSSSGRGRHTGTSKPLPRISLPRFSGRYQEWTSFRDLFMSMVGNNNDLTQVEKLHYLKANVTDDAAKLIASIPITEENFDRAWSKLQSRFENKRALINAQLDLLFALKPLPRKSAHDLERLRSTVAEVIESLEALGGPVQSWDYFLVYFVCLRLDPESHEAWEIHLGNKTDPPTYKELYQFLDGRIRALESVDARLPGLPKARSSPSVPQSRLQSASRSFLTTKTSSCPCCNSAHYIGTCPTYLAKTPSQRKDFVKEKNLCFNCLGSHPRIKCRSTRRWTECRKDHHSTLHSGPREPLSTSPSSQAFSEVSYPSSSSSGASQGRESSVAQDRRPAVIHAASNLRSSTLVPQPLLATALIYAISPQGPGTSARALLDQGSEMSFVCESLIQSLQLPRCKSSICLLGIGAQKHATTRGKVNLGFQSYHNSAIEFTVQAYVLPKVTGVIPAAHIDARSWNHLSGLTLADPSFANPGHIDVLLGADIYGHLLEEGIRKGSINVPVAQSTCLGCIVSGPTLNQGNSVPRGLFCSVDHELNDLVQQFWAQETVCSPEGERLSEEDSQCEDHFAKTHTRDSTGRYVVRLPFRTQPDKLGDSRSIARRSLTNMHRRFERDDSFKQLYVAFMDEYLNLRHMEVADSYSGEDVFFLPHHGVKRETSTTTKLRVVFNGSQKTNLGRSLNDSLLSGPKIQTDLVDVILRWRFQAYAFTAEIEKMYRQIIIHSDDRKYQRILWSGGSTKPVETFQLSTVTYGLTSAPFLAIRVLRQLAEDEGAYFPAARDAVLNNFYVDDVLSGSDSVEGAQEKVMQIDQLLKKGGFLLQKWASNDTSVLNFIENKRKISSCKILEDGNTLRALGLTWNPNTDSFVFTFIPRSISVEKLTKRAVLSVIARLFDPLGWLAPLIVVAKIFLQSLWKTDLQWDDPLPEDLIREWTKFARHLDSNISFSIPRWLGASASEPFEIHGFADASQSALAAVVYVRVAAENHHARVTILMAKSKVAPLKRVSIARLELSAAVLLAQLVANCLACLRLTDVLVYLWSDSSVALTWIGGQPSQWKDYVGNRVQLIHELVPLSHWRHVPGIENPADAASRGLTPAQLLNHPLWWHGPPWLSSHNSTWPNSSPHLPENANLEERLPVVASVSSEITTWDLVNRYSSLDRLLRVTAYLLRATALLRRRLVRDELSSTLSAEELEGALMFWVQKTQTSHFAQDINRLKSGDQLPVSNHLMRMSPFLDGKGLLRVGGRLHLSSLNYNEKHPLLLPRRSPLSSLIIDDVHRRTLHGGVQLTLATLRQKFWILGGRAPVRSYILRCVPCTRQRGTTAKQMMGQLPSFRTAPSRPFLHSGVDYAGPFKVKAWKGRGAKVYKAFLIVFVCFATSAVHLELATDYSTEGFLAAYRRFAGRRGACASITSDNGSNLVGADAELCRLFNAASKEFSHLQSVLAADRTNWRFNPPSAPHFGGKWEAAVKSTKHHIKRIIGETCLTYEEFSCFLAQVEGILNSCPLCPLSEDPNDLTALTPGHFLTGGPLNAIPEPSLCHLTESRLSRWQRTSLMVSHFWRRWSREYLQRMQSVSKWNQPRSEISQGSLVLISDDRYPPTRWPLARVINVHPGADGLVRVVTLRTATGEFKRPVVKLCPLPVPRYSDGDGVGCD